MLMFPVLVFVGLYSLPGWNQDAGPKAWFREEAAIGWNKYWERARKFQGTFAFRDFSVHDNKYLGEENGEFRQKEGCILFLAQSVLEGGRATENGELGAVNGDYEFKLHRGGPNSAWTVAEIGKNLWRLTPDTGPTFLVEGILRRPITFTTISTDLRQTLLDPRFSIENVTRLQEDGDAVVKVEFRYSPPKGDARQPNLRGWAVFDPQRYWVMRRFETKAIFGGVEINYAGTLQYISTPEGFPILKGTETTRRIPSKAREFQAKHSFSLVEREVPDREFRLSAFGFPEPGSAPRAASSHWYLVFVGIGIAAVGLGGYLFHRRRTRALDTKAN